MIELSTPNHQYPRDMCGIGVFQPKTKENIGTLIRSAVNFNANFVFTIGKRYRRQCSAIKLDTKIPIFNFATVGEFKSAMPPVEKFIGVDLTTHSTPLRDFRHPKTGIYLLGSEDNGLPEEVLQDERFEFIEIEGGRSLNVAVAGSIVLYDRQRGDE